jgi:hypothetical protein
MMIILFGLFLAALICINKPQKNNIGKYQSIDRTMVLDTETGHVYIWDPSVNKLRPL